PHVQGDVERLVERLVGQDGPVEQPGNQDEVARTGNRGELGEALDDSQDDRLQGARGGLLPEIRPGRCDARWYRAGTGDLAYWPPARHGDRVISWPYFPPRTLNGRCLRRQAPGPEPSPGVCSCGTP